MGAFGWGPAAEIVARATGTRPVWSIEASRELGLSAARWQLASLPPIGGILPLGILAYRAAGSAWATIVWCPPIERCPSPPRWRLHRGSLGSPKVGWSRGSRAASVCTSVWTR